MSLRDTFGEQLKQIPQSLLRRFGYQIQKLPHRLVSVKRVVGNMPCFLEDIKARGFSPRTIVDVGAHRGDWSKMAAEIFPQASYIMIEPQEEMGPDIEKFVASFPKARWIKAGAGATEAKLDLTIWDDFAGSSFLPDETAPVEGKKRRTVDIVTLDSLFPGTSGWPDLVKLDVQGFELEALKGAETLFGHAELFILEVSLFKFMPNMPLVSEVVAFMDQRGYVLYDLPGYVRRPYDAALGQVDMAFAKRDGSLRRSQEW